MRHIKRPKNLAERLLRISKLHIFELYLFRCCLFTTDGQLWIGVSNVERQGETVTLTFEEYTVPDGHGMSTDSYAIVDDEDYLVQQRYLDEEKHYAAGETLRMSFEVTHDSG